MTSIGLNYIFQEYSFPFIFLVSDLRISLDEITEHLRRSQRFILKGRDILNGRLQPVAGHSESKEAKNKGRRERKISIVSTNRGINNTGLSRMHSAVDRLSINQKKFLFSWKKITILDDGAETRDSEISWETCHV